ncbi:MAG: hypothetical protein WEC33_08165 [Dehalococcoidia bacterium]
METRPPQPVWLRLAPWAGIAFAVLFVAGFVISGTTPDYDEAAEWQEWLNDSGNRQGAWVGGLIMVVGAFALLWFSQALAWRLKSDANPLAQIASSSAVVMVTMLLTAVFFGVAVPVSIEVADAPVPSSDIAIQFEQVAFGFLLVGTCFAGALYIATTTTLARGTWPSWMVWVSYGAAVLLLFGPLFFPMVALPLWALLTGIYLLRRPL